MVSEPSLTIGRSPRIGNMLDSFIVIGMTANLIVVKATNPSHCRFSFVSQKCSNPCGEFFAAMDDIWKCSDYLTTGGFPPLLWETLQRLGYTEPPTYYYCECDVEGVLKCEMHLHITEHPTNTEFRVRCILAYGRKLEDTCQIAARGALMCIC